MYNNLDYESITKKINVNMLTIWEVENAFLSKTTKSEIIQRKIDRDN